MIIMFPNPNMQNRGPQNFMQNGSMNQGPMNNATSGGQAYNFMSGGRPQQPQPNMHPGTRPPMPQGGIMPAGQQSPMPAGMMMPQQRPMGPSSPFGQQGAAPIPQGTQVPPNMETKTSITDPIDMNKIANFSIYMNSLRNPRQLQNAAPQNYPDINVFNPQF